MNERQLISPFLLFCLSIPILFGITSCKFVEGESEETTGDEKVFVSQCKGDDINGYYVAASGADDNAGTFDEPFATIQKALSSADPGQTIYVKAGVYDGGITFPKSGESDNRITLRSCGDDKVVLTHNNNKSQYVIDITRNYISIENVIVDGQWRTSDIIKIRNSGNYVILQNLEVKNTRKDGIDLDNPVGVLIENCTIHDALNADEATGERIDAHGIVTGGVQDLIIRNTEIYYVSGDAMQFQYNGWDNIQVENCTLWNGKLPDARGGFPAGVNPGENAVDTKYYTTDGRGRLYFKNIIAHGWRSDYISNAAAFNIKHNVQAEIDGVTTYNNEIAFRLRGPASSSTGGAWVTLQNAVIYDSDKAIRYEDDIENLKIYNSTFGKENGVSFESAGGYGSGFEAKNNLFINSKPSEASGSSNLAVDESSFVNVATHDYHLTDFSSAIEAGEFLSGVTHDRDGISRPKGSQHDVGAYEYQ